MLTVELIPCSAQKVRIFFINPHPACCETEKGGEGERDTGKTVKGVPPCMNSLRQPAVPVHQAGARRCKGEPPPPSSAIPLLYSLWLQQWISRTASYLKVMNMKTDIGQG